LEFIDARLEATHELLTTQLEEQCETTRLLAALAET